MADQDTAWSNFNEYQKEKKRKIGPITPDEERALFIGYLKKNYKVTLNEKDGKKAVTDIIHRINDYFEILIGYMRHQENVGGMYRDLYEPSKESLLWSEFVEGIDVLRWYREHFKCSTLMNSIRRPNREFMPENVDRGKIADLRDKQREIRNSYDKECKVLNLEHKAAREKKGYKKKSNYKEMHDAVKALQDKYENRCKPHEDKLKSFLNVEPSSREYIEKVKGEFYKIISPYEEMLKEALLSPVSQLPEALKNVPKSLQNVFEILAQESITTWDDNLDRYVWHTDNKRHMKIVWDEIRSGYNISIRLNDFLKYFTYKQKPCEHSYDSLQKRTGYELNEAKNSLALDFPNLFNRLNNIKIIDTKLKSPRSDLVRQVSPKSLLKDPKGLF